MVSGVVVKFLTSLAFLEANTFQSKKFFSVSEVSFALSVPSRLSTLSVLLTSASVAFNVTYLVLLVDSVPELSTFTLVPLTPFSESPLDVLFKPAELFLLSVPSLVVLLTLLIV